MKTLLPSLLLLAAFATPAAEPGDQHCHQIQADLFEVASSEGCNAGLDSCFLGEVDGNFGLRGTTHFYADSSATGPDTSPGFFSYGGEFEYRTADGTIYAHETGVTDPERVTAYQQITSGTGRYQGASGYFFVSGFKSGSGPDTTVDTSVTGEICPPR